ncbi:UNVERIFIED_CONTAM: hypothetical protein Slati_3700500 [Sesamum latifolium]|uniref:Chromo domain-containing protein n=1 Tax=Sesamum latifolium TaxID=2727402 RepID=A0AAW2U3J2_9LAMI
MRWRPLLTSVARKPVEPQASASGVNDSEEDEDNLGAISQWCNTLSHQVAAKKTVPPRAGKTAPALTGNHPEEEAQPRNPRKKGLMFVDVKIHGKPIRAMIDTGATHNYLASAEVERLGLVLEKGVGRVKAINSAAQPIAGVAKSVLIKVGPFEGKTNLSVVVMDDFKLILGLEFLRDTRTAFEKGCKRSEPSYLCTLRFDEIEEASGPIPGVVKKLLREFEDVMPDELPRKLPPKRTVDHEIELVPGTKPPARAPYRMSQPELVELRKQLKEMLESGIIKPAKSPGLLRPSKPGEVFYKDRLEVGLWRGPRYDHEAFSTLRENLDDEQVEHLREVCRSKSPLHRVQRGRPCDGEGPGPEIVEVIKGERSSVDAETRKTMPAISPAPQLELTKTKEKVAEVILNHRVTRTAKREHTEYLVKWKGCSSEEKHLGAGDEP